MAFRFQQEFHESGRFVLRAFLSAGAFEPEDLLKLIDNYQQVLIRRHSGLASGFNQTQRTRKEPGDYGALAAQAHLWRKAGYDEWAKYYFLRFKCEDENWKVEAPKKRAQALENQAAAESRQAEALREHEEEAAKLAGAEARRNQDLAKHYDPKRYQLLAAWVDQQLRRLPHNLPHVDCSTPPDTVTDTDRRIKKIEAEEAAQIGEYDAAIALLGTVIQEEPENIELLLSRARYRKWRGNWEAEGSDQRKALWDGARQGLRISS